MHAHEVSAACHHSSSAFLPQEQAHLALPADTDLAAAPVVAGEDSGRESTDVQFHLLIYGPGMRPAWLLLHNYCFRACRQTS